MEPTLAFVLIFFAFILGFALGLFAPVVAAKVCQIFNIEIGLDELGGEDKDEEK